MRNAFVDNTEAAKRAIWFFFMFLVLPSYVFFLKGDI